MTTVLLIVHFFVTIALIGVVLIQRSEGGGLGIGSSQGMGAFMTGRGTANLLTRTTAILATIFMALALVLAVLNRGTGGVGRTVLDIPANNAAAPAARPVSPVPENQGGNRIGTQPATTGGSVNVPAQPSPGAAGPGAAAPAGPSAPAAEPNKPPSVPTN